MPAPDSMAASGNTTPYLSDHLLEFLYSGVSISLAAAGSDGKASITKAQGCHVTDRRRITVFASRSASIDVIRCCGETGQVTAVFSMPATHETYQIKGHHPRVEPLTRDDFTLLHRYRIAFSAQIASFGYPPQMADALFDFPAEDMVAISFEAHSIFDQTPGPRAGEAVGSR